MEKDSAHELSEASTKQTKIIKEPLRDCQIETKVASAVVAAIVPPAHSHRPGNQQIARLL